MYCSPILNLVTARLLVSASSQIHHFRVIKLLSKEDVLCHAGKTHFLKLSEIVPSKWRQWNFEEVVKLPLHNAK